MQISVIKIKSRKRAVAAGPLAYRGEIAYPPLGYRDEQTDRPRPGHTRPPAPETPRARAALSGDVLQVSEGSLYPALHKLEQEGWIKAEWKTTENNRKAKFYALTRLGRKQLEAEAVNWKRLSSAISHVVQLSEL